MTKGKSEPEALPDREKFSPPAKSAMLLLLAALLRALQLSVELQYDEIWTLLNFTDLNVFQILTDLSLPNNHPLNTLVLKFLSTFSDMAIILRLGVFLCGIAVVYLCGKCAGLISQKADVIHAAQFLSAVSMPLIFFSVFARGYIYQIAALQLCIWGIYRCAAKDDDSRAPFLVLSGGILTFISVSSGVMFLFCAALGELWLTPAPRRFNKKILWSGSILALTALGYCLFNYKQLRTGQQWGIGIDSFSTWCSFFSRTTAALLPLFLIPWVIAGVVFNKVLRKILFLGILPLLLAVFTKGGPERVYLPLAVIFIIIAACGYGTLQEKFPRYRKLLLPALILSGVGCNLLPEPVWELQTPGADLRYALASTNDTTIVVMHASAGYPAMLNDADSAKRAEQRSLFPAENLAMLHCAEGEFNGSDIKNSEVREFFPLSGKPLGFLPGYSYTLKKIATPAKGDVVLFLFSGAVPEEFIQYPGRKLRLNLWFNRNHQLYICEITQPEIAFDWSACYRIGEKK